MDHMTQTEAPLKMRKAGIIGCGYVGSASAFALMQSGLFSEIVLIDIDRERAEGEAMDISHGIPFAGPMSIYAGDYKDLADASIVVVTAGANQRPDETRLDLVHKNAKIMRSVAGQIREAGFHGILLIVSNPVDVLTYVAQQVSGLPKKHVIGSGTVLDSARLKQTLGRHLGVDSRSVHAFIVGEHGDSEIAVWSSANVSGVPLNRMCEMRGFYDHENNRDQIEDSVRCSAYEIIARKDATYYGIAMVVRRICQAIVRDEKSVFPVSSYIDGAYGLSDIVLSMPAIVGADGVETLVPISVDAQEMERLHESADTLRQIVESLQEI